MCTHRGDSNEYTQHTTIVKEIKKNPLNYRYLLPDLAPWLTLSGSNYPCLKQFSMVQKMFEPLKFDCILDSMLNYIDQLWLFRCELIVHCFLLICFFFVTRETASTEIQASTTVTGYFRSMCVCKYLDDLLSIENIDFEEKMADKR